jgi:uridine kinase
MMLLHAQQFPGILSARNMQSSFELRKVEEVKKVFIGLLVGYLINSSYVASTIIFLKGPNSTGKTSLCRELVSLNKQWKWLDEDDFYIEQSLQTFACHFSQDYALLEKAIDHANLFHAIKYHEVLFKNTASKPDKQRAHKALNHIRSALAKASHALYHQNVVQQVKQQLITHLNEYLVQGYHVIVDSWLLDKAIINTYKKQHKTHTVVVYCSLNEILHRINQRNHQALKNNDFHNRRLFKQALISFFKFFSFKNSKHYMPIAYVSKQQMLSAFKKVITYAHQLKHHEYPSAEFEVKKLENFRKKIASSYTGSTLLLQSTIGYDYLLCTDHRTPQVCATLLLQWEQTQS